MKRKILVGFGTVACLGICAVVIYAQIGNSPSVPQVEVNARFASADKNGDGVLSKEEFAGYLAKIQQIGFAAKKDGNCCSEKKEAETVAVKFTNETPAKKESGCCGGKDKTKAEKGDVAKKEGGCCSEKKGAETVAVKFANETPAKKEGGCCGGKDKAKTEKGDVAKKDGGCCDEKDNAKTEDTNVVKVSEAAASDHATLKVGGACGMCKKRIETAAKSLEGVVAATWDTKAKILQVAFNSPQTSLDAISKAVAKAGHDTEKDKTDDETYNALHECCKYRK
ncbi:MAG: cation transporter [Planctomycetaceae bacterium]|nr:cation transporter [Planctomycetaceae bacterium]